MADLHTRLAAWRQVGDVAEQSPEYRQAAGDTEALLKASQDRIARMCHTHIRNHAAFFADLLDTARQEGRDDPQLAQRVADMCTVVLRQYELSGSLLLRMGIEQEIKRFLREIGNTTHQPPPLP
jgi:hypothetical protein